MKKRILALALAGTTAFSVFGAAMSANAASSHVVYGNDPYVSYQPAEVTWNTEAGAINPATGSFLTNSEIAALPDTAADYYAANEADVLKDMGYVRQGDGTGVTVYKHTVYPDAEKTFVDYTYYSIYGNDLSATDVVLTADKDGVKANTIEGWTGTGVFIKSGEYNGKIYAGGDVYAKALEYIATDLSDKIESSYTKAIDQGSITVNTAYKYKYSVAHGEGALVAEELSREGVTVENGNVYAYDYYTSDYSVAAFEDAWNEANFKREAATENLISVSTTNKALINTMASINGNGDTTKKLWNYEKGVGGYYTVRRAVVEEFEDFLFEIGLKEYGYGSIVVDGLSKDEFLSMYTYKYGANDEYNFEGLTDDLYKASINNSYVNMSTSNLVYLMQQYDKYVDGSYIGETELGDDRWADLLIDALNAVEIGDFTTASAFNAFKRTANIAIGTYEGATTTAAQNRAIAGLYDAVTSVYGRSSGVDKTELVANLDSLYFNNKSIPAVYLEKYDRDSVYADLTLYTYDGLTLSANGLTGSATVDIVKTVYPLYPADDYEGTKGAEYAGIKAGTVADGVSAEYEWFANVYQLATTINAQNKSGSYQGIVDTVNEALAEAVADLAVTTTPAGSASMRLEEAVEAYADKEEGDYIAKYFGAYTEANAYAENVEGKYQTLYAIEMVESAGQALSYQGTQTTVTKGMIANLKTAIADGEKALKALKDDKDNYNAAQVLALNKAIDGAQAIVNDYNGTTATKVNHKPTTTAGDKDNFVISDVNAAIAAIDDAIAYKNVIQGWSKNADGAWQYGTADGYLNNTSGTNKDGWVKIRSGEIVDDKAPGQWYKFTEDGTIYTSYWLKENGKDYYLKADGAAAIGWAKIDNQWYYFGGDCAMKTGWVKSGGNWYYLSTADSTKGEMVTGWAEVGGKWYYFSKEENAVGQMLYNTTTPDGYKVNEDGVWVK